MLEFQIKLNVLCMCDVRVKLSAALYITGMTFVLSVNTFAIWYKFCVKSHPYMCKNALSCAPIRHIYWHVMYVIAAKKKTEESDSIDKLDSTGKKQRLQCTWCGW